jgi:DNA-binding transcriptional LysR family regulator
MMERIQDDFDQVRRLGRGEQGTLTVGFSGSIMFTDLPVAIESYRRQYPKVELRLREMSTAAQIAGLLDRTLDLALLRDGDPTEGLEIGTLMKERFVAVLPGTHALARRRALRVADLHQDPFVLFARRMGPLAFDRTIACCQQGGFHPRIVQEGTQWPTIVRLVAAGLGVSLAPACIATVAIPGAVYREVRAACRTTVDIGVKVGAERALILNFREIARQYLARSAC